MPSVGHFLQTYVNNRHNLLFALIIVIAVVISLIPELVLHNAREELLKTIYPKSIDSEASIPSSSERGLSHKQTVFPKFFSTNNIASNRNITKELEEYLENLENYSVLKENVLALSDQLSKIESYQQQQKEEIPTPSTADIESTNKPTEYQEKLQNQYQIMLDKQSHLLTLIKQAKEYQSLQHSQIKQLEQNLTTFMEQHYAEKQYIEHHLQRLQEKLNHYQNILTNSKQQHSFYIDLMNGSNSMSQALVDVNNKIKQVMAYDEKLCKDRINLLKRHQIKFQKEEFEQLIKSTVNEKLLAYASLHETSAPQTSNNSSHRPYDEYSCQPVQKMVQEKADYALLSAGAEVLLAETSPTYVPYELQIKNALHQIAHNLGLEDYFPSEYIPEFESTHQWTEAVGLFYGVGSVQDVLRPDIRLGNCWPMNGTSGFFAVKLKNPVFVESISLDHIGKSEARDWRTAPKDFRVYGSLDLARGWRELVADSFEPNRTTASHNYVIPPSEENYGPVQYLKLNILSNHGNPEYTCLYRFRVHGEVV